jgi:hypothetical protein
MAVPHYDFISARVTASCGVRGLRTRPLAEEAASGGIGRADGRGGKYQCAATDIASPFPRSGHFVGQSVDPRRSPPWAYEIT